MSRYQLLRNLGHGGMGVVDLVHDTVRDQVVARKRMLADSAEARLQFKREFRAVESLRHPNIVVLHELGEEEDRPFFTMEHVPGVDFRRYCAQPAAPGDLVAASTAIAMRPADPPWPGDTLPLDEASPGVIGPAAAAALDEERLDALLAQLIEALRFLHGAGVVHRDLKPSNVLVRDDGHVKVLDFGLAIEEVPWSAAPEQLAGTPAYMAPEQIGGRRSSPAADAYALGVMLFEVVAGRPPFLGDLAQVVRAHVEKEAPRLDALCPGAPRRYAGACARLLQKEPADRATLEELEVLLDLARTPRRPSAAGRALIGRAPIQRTLELQRHRTFAGAFAIASLMGPTGIGKTALLDWIAREAAREGGVVLRGRARLTEHIAFNALDGAIDGLALVLRAAGGALASGEALAIAGGVFPVLGGGARGAATRPAAFAAIAELVRAVAASSQVTLIVDDVQWADADSLALLDELVRRAPGRALIVAACRDDVGETAGAAWARRHGGDVLVVAPLPAAAVGELVLRRVREHTPEAAIPERTLARVVGQCDGRPVLAELAARELASGWAAPAGDADLASALVARVRAAPRGVRRLLAILAAAERWTGEVLLRSVSTLSPAELTDALAQLQHQGLAVAAMTPGGHARIDLAHDVVRAAVLEGLDAGELRAAHDAWADALALDFDWDPAGLYRRVHHLVAAGRLEEAAPLAADAARGAARHGALGLAAELYDLALRVERDDAARLLRARAVVLEDAGRHREAAAVWRTLHGAASAGSAASAASAAEARLQAAAGEAQSLFAGGEVTAGLERLEAALVAAGEPSARAVGLRGAASIAAFFLGPRGRLRTGAAPAPEERERERAEHEVRVAQSLVVSDPLASHRLLQRAQARALRRGLAEIAAWCDYLFAGQAMFLGPRAGPSRLGARYLARGDRLLGGRAPRSVEVLVSRGMALFWSALREARWEECLAIVEREIARLEQEGRSGSFAHVLCLSQRISIDSLRLDCASHARHVSRLREAARGGAASGLAFHVVMAFADAMTFRGDFGEAYALLADRLEAAPRGTFQHQLAHGSLMHHALAERRLAQARAHALALDEQPWPRGIQTFYAGAFAGRLAAIEAACLRAGLPGAQAARLRALVRIGRRAPPLALPLVLRAEASLAELEGDRGGARWLLLRAEREAEQLAMPFDVARARHQRAELLGAAGAALRASARDLAASTGASELVLERLP